MEFCIEMKMTVQDASEALATRVPINLQVFHRGGRWQAQCMEPPLITDFCESMEEALRTAAREACKELSDAASSS